MLHSSFVQNSAASSGAKYSQGRLITPTSQVRTQYLAFESRGLLHGGRNIPLGHRGLARPRGIQLRSELWGAGPFPTLNWLENPDWKQRQACLRRNSPLRRSPCQGGEVTEVLCFKYCIELMSFGYRDPGSRNLKPSALLYTLNSSAFKSYIEPEYMPFCFGADP